MIPIPRQERIREILTDLVRIKSLSASPSGENEAARYIAVTLSRSLPEGDVTLVPIQGDALGRVFVIARVRARPKTDRTIVLTGHFDVVGAEGYGSLESVAFDPDVCTRRIGERNIPDEARRDLESGDYLFGRGVADMKFGIALEMTFLEAAAASPGSLGANLMMLAVPDEESDSAGMRAAISELARLQDSGETFLACVNTEPCVGDGGSGRAMIHLGTIGKIMPLFYCVGRETHVGDYFEGCNAALVAAHLETLCEADPSTSETVDGRRLPPQSCLRMRDLRPHYAVTLPDRAVVFCNRLIVNETPASVLAGMRAVAAEALRRTDEQLRSAACALGKQYGPGTAAPAVYTVDELIRNGTGSESDPTDLPGDVRDHAIAELGRVVRESGITGPAVVLGFLPPFYPPRRNRRTCRGEIACARAAEIAVKTAAARGHDIDVREIFEGIMDLSYLGFQGAREELDPLSANMPFWGTEYGIPLDDLCRLDIPGINIGPIGKDAHKDTERLNLPYSFGVLPPVLASALETLARS
jgi:arginine utilization protein RocB